MEELRALHKKLTEERSAKGTDIERRRVRIEQTEKKVSFNPPPFQESRAQNANPIPLDDGP